MKFEILGEISNAETFATSSAIRESARLRRVYGRGRWRKRKGIARVRLSDGSVHLAGSALVRSLGDRAQGIQDQALAVRSTSHGKAASKQIGRLCQQRWLLGVARAAKNLRRAA